MGMSALCNRRKRRQNKAQRKNVKAKPVHKLKTGRTGDAFSKKNHSKKLAKYSSFKTWAETLRSLFI